MDSPLFINLANRRYPIYIASGALAAAGTLIAQHLGAGTRCVVIADQQVAAIYATPLLEGLRSAGLTADCLEFPPGEPSKNLAQAEALWQHCADLRLDRRSAIIALGGGVCGDLAGFVAACWMRGIRLVQIPTTLLAMVDSAVGGKTAVNAPAGKNLIGAFHQPSLVICDPLTLPSMDRRAYLSGLAEVVKYGVIFDPDFFAWQESSAQALCQGEPAAVIEAVRRSCAIKAWFVAEDEREQGLRAHLNYGHTFAHALEGEGHYTRYLHGEAVAIGMRMAAACSQALGICQDTSLIPRQDALLAALGLPLQHQLSEDSESELDRLCQRCYLDKKVQGGHTRFILPSHLGRVAIVENPDPEAVRAGFRGGCG